jgi:hypothetical protein
MPVVEMPGDGLFKSLKFQVTPPSVVIIIYKVFLVI